MLGTGVLELYERNQIKLKYFDMVLVLTNKNNNRQRRMHPYNSVIKNIRVFPEF
jgi:hypothetical protein